ncbi:MAG: hypothetical protein GQ557_01965 [Mycoplasmataceae bacterium]|nr:hypothetical protein [Mycoplasmataceae bacterium]
MNKNNENILNFKNYYTILKLIDNDEYKKIWAFNFLSPDDKNFFYRSAKTSGYKIINISPIQSSQLLKHYIKDVIHDNNFILYDNKNIFLKINGFELKKELNKLVDKQAIKDVEDFENNKHFETVRKLFEEKILIATQIKDIKHKKISLEKNIYKEKIRNITKELELERLSYTRMSDVLMQTITMLYRVEKKEFKKNSRKIAQKTLTLMTFEIKTLIHTVVNTIEHSNLHVSKEIFYEYEKNVSKDNVLETLIALEKLIKENPLLFKKVIIKAKLNTCVKIFENSKLVFSHSFTQLKSYIRNELEKIINYIDETTKNINENIKITKQKQRKEIIRDIINIYESDLIKLKYELTIFKEVKTVLNIYDQRITDLQKVYSLYNIKIFKNSINEFLKWYNKVTLSLNSWSLRNEKSRINFLYQMKLLKLKDELKIFKKKQSIINHKMNEKHILNIISSFELKLENRKEELKVKYLTEVTNKSDEGIINFIEKNKLNIKIENTHRMTHSQKQKFVKTINNDLLLIFGDELLAKKVKNLSAKDLVLLEVYLSSLQNKKLFIDFEANKIKFHDYNSLSSSITNINKKIEMHYVLVSSHFIDFTDKHLYGFVFKNNYVIEMGPQNIIYKNPKHKITIEQFEILNEIKTLNLSNTFFPDKKYIYPKYEIVKYRELEPKHFILEK